MRKSVESFIERSSHKKQDRQQVRSKTLRQQAETIHRVQKLRTEKLPKQYEPKGDQ